MNKKYIGAAVAAFGVYGMFFSTVPDTTSTGFHLLFSGSTAGSPNPWSFNDLRQAEGGMFWLYAAAIGAGTYMYFKGKLL